MGKRQKPKSYRRIQRIRTMAMRLTALVALVLLVCDRRPPVEDALHLAIECAGFFLLVGGILGRLWCTLYIGGRKTKELVTSGPYALCRNPLYFFSTSIAAGAFLILQNLLFTLLCGTSFVIFHALAVRAEEAKLRQHFGEAFEGYCRQVPRFLPDLRNWRRAVVDETVFFAPSQALRVLLDATPYLMVLPLAEILEQLYQTGILPLHLG